MCCVCGQVGDRFCKDYRNKRPLVFCGLDLPAQHTWTDLQYLRGLSTRKTVVHRVLASGVERLDHKVGFDPTAVAANCIERPWGEAIDLTLDSKNAGAHQCKHHHYLKSDMTTELQREFAYCELTYGDGDDHFPQHLDTLFGLDPHTPGKGQKEHAFLTSPLCPLFTAFHFCHFLLFLINCDRSCENP